MATYFITGAGSGIGRAAALLLAKKGETIYMLGRDEKKLKETLQLLPEGRHRIFVADIKDREVLDRIATSLGVTGIDGLIASAGIGGTSFWSKPSRWDDIIATNLTGTYNFISTFQPFLIRSDQRYKNIVIVSSALAQVGMPNYQALSASKAGLLGLMRCCAVQWAQEKILVNAITPGWVNTKMASNDIEEFATAYNISKEEAIRGALKGVPIGRMCEPEEIAEFINYLLQQGSMTGSIVDINGGLVMTP
jgi:NAD(P)-dependent dehydrogenase (short-subunit alcohol dehydrogenase family)